MLTGKQKQFLRALANSRRPLFQVGKDGVTANVINTVSDSLEAHELIKISVLKTCGEDVREVALDLSAGTRSQIVQIIGLTVILSRECRDKKRNELPR